MSRTKPYRLQVEINEEESADFLIGLQYSMRSIIVRNLIKAFIESLKLDPDISAHLFSENISIVEKVQ